MNGQAMRNFIQDVYGKTELPDDAESKINQILHDLSDREEIIVRSYFGLNDEKKTLTELAHGFGISPQRVSQMKVLACKKLRHPARAKVLFG
ncbi:MAG: hypothetical protein K6E59_06495 [Bacilli bacterium]|nr:hypothetical protein [Bacilli bacterium]